MNTGDIYLVKFHPGQGAEFQKYRPAVMVSEKITLIDGRFTLIAPLTTSSKVFNEKSEFQVRNNDALERESVLLCWYLWTIDVSRLIRRLGELSESDRKRMQKIVRDLISGGAVDKV